MQDFAAHSIGHIAPQTILYEGRYRIDLLLAAAPTRAVYRAWDLTQHRPATILELATPDAATAAAALKQAAPLVQLNHAALTPIQVIFVEHGTFFLALTLAGGQTIERIMAERANPITPAAAVRWIAQAAEGVEFLDAELPTWHLGDLSPAALLVTAEDRVQLLGFEVALGLLTPQALTAALPVGTVAPELAEGQCDARADVYGLAATLYYLLTRQRWSVQRESLANARPDLSRALVATVMRGLATSPAARWPDAATFYQELLRALPLNHPAQHGAPWWDDEQPQIDGLAEEPPTLITTRDQLRAAVAAQQAALGTPAADETSAPSPLGASTAPIDTYIVLSPERPPADGATPTPAHADSSTAANDDAVQPESPPELSPASIAAPEADSASQAEVDATNLPAIAVPAEDIAIIPEATTATAALDDIPTAPEAPQSELAAADDAATLDADASNADVATEDTDTHNADAAASNAPDPEAGDAVGDDALSALEETDAAPIAAEPDVASEMPEPVAATIIRPRWPWSTTADDVPTADPSPPETSANGAEPASIAAEVPDAPPSLQASPEVAEPAPPDSLSEPAETLPADEDVGAAPIALPEPAFADTLLRWPPLVDPETPTSENGTAGEVPVEQMETEQPTSNGAVADDNQEPHEHDESADLTALPTQLNVPNAAIAVEAATDNEPTRPPPYSLWAAQAASPPQYGADSVTAPIEETSPLHLMLDEDIVAATPNSQAPTVTMPEAAATDTTAAIVTATVEAASPPMPPATTPAAEQVIVAHSDYMSSAPPPVDPPKTTKTPSRPLGSGLLDKLRGILHTPGPLPALATGTVVVPRHMYPQHTYSVLVRVQCRPATTPAPEPTKKEATFIIVEVAAAGDAFYVPVRRLALRLPNEGGLSEGTFTITALRPSVPNETDPITFTFRSVDNQLLHDGQFLAEISILSPQQLAGGNPMLTLVHALDIELALA